MEELKSSNDPWKEILKDKMANYEAISQPNWDEFSQKLAKPSGISNNPFFKQGFFYGAAVLVVAVSLSYFVFNKDQSSSTILSNQSNEITSNEIVTNPGQVSSQEVNSEKNTLSQITDESQISDNQVLSQNIDRISASVNQQINQTKSSTTSKTINTKPDDMQQAVQVNKKSTSLPLIPNPKFTFSVDQSCSPMIVNCQPQELSDSIFYLWTTSDGQVSTQALSSFTLTRVGEHWITLTVNYFQSAEKASYTEQEGIFVNPSPNSDFIVDNQKNHYEFRPIVGEHLSYTWKISDLTIEDVRDLEYTFGKSGTYPILLKVRSAEGCYSESKKEIQVKVLHPVFVGNAFTPDGDGINDYFGPKSEAIEEYDYTMEIYNRIGGLVFRTTSADVLWDGSIQGQEPASEGFYHYKILTRDKSGNSQTKTGEVFLIRKK
jgi:gliding motility-associated-like protein